ncbi:MAG: hypothetical protein QOD45_571, partial [Pseudonocardiales bacterium]|nr:hypothetical protein [Pseudonocardiales bacterium]
AIAVSWYGQPHRAVPGSDIVWTLLAMLFAYFWIVGNAHYAGENVYAIRDPSTYAIAGRWLMDHHSLAIHAHPEIFGEPSTVAGVESGGFNATHHIPVLYAQGNHLLPVALGLAGFCFGQSALFSANIVFGGLALFVFFGLARRVLRSGGLALLAMVALGLTVPMVYVARDTFSEPLTMLFLTGGLSLVYRAAQSRRPRDFALAAFVGACSAMLRIDSYASLIGFVAAAAMVCVVAPGADRRRAALCAVAAVAGGAGPTVIGWMDVAWLSRQYYWSQHANITALIKLLILLVVALPVLVAASWWSPVRRVLTRPSTRRVVARAAIGGLLLAFAILVSRPWWYLPEQKSVNPTLASLQRSSGLPADGLRLYSEQTVHWLAMYLGWPTVVLAVLGYCALLHRFLASREYALAGPLGAGLALSALYLWNPQIYPDQPWAMRRYVPVVLPVLVIAAVVGLQLLGRLAIGELRIRRLRADRQPWVRRAAVVATAVAGVLLLLVPWVVLRPVWKVRQEGGQYQQLAALCAALPANAAVVELDRSAQAGYGQTLRAYCDVPTFALPGASQNQLATMSVAVQHSGRVLYALASTPDRYRYAADSGPATFSTVTTSRWTTHIGRAPSGPRYDCITVHLARIDDMGLAHSVAGGPLVLTGPCVPT